MVFLCNWVIDVCVGGRIVNIRLVWDSIVLPLGSMAVRLAYVVLLQLV